MRIAALGVGLAAAAAENGRWPRAIPLEQATLVVYQPQLENIEGVTLSGRMAVSWEPPNGTPVFGVVWFDARFLADKDSREVQIEQFTVSKVRFPESTPEQESKITAYLEKEVPQWDLRPSEWGTPGGTMNRVCSGSVKTWILSVSMLSVSSADGVRRPPMT